MNLQILNTKIIKEVGEQLGFKVFIFDENGNFISVKTQKGDLFFCNYSTSFNTHSFYSIVKDKEFTYRLLRGVVRMPKTLAITDPNYYVSEINNSIDLKRIEEIGFPLVIKPNNLSKGRGVALCHNQEEVLSAIKNIFLNNKNYDYLALAQEYIDSEEEFRVVVFKNEILLVYSDKRLVEDEYVLGKLRNFILPVFSVLDIGFAGFDIILDKTGQFWLLEINSSIGFENFVRKYGDGRLKEMYKKILKKYL